MEGQVETLIQTELALMKETGGTVVYGNEETLKTVYIPKTLLTKPYPGSVSVVIQRGV